MVPVPANMFKPTFVLGWLLVISGAAWVMNSGWPLIVGGILLMIGEMV